MYMYGYPVQVRAAYLSNGVERSRLSLYWLVMENIPLISIFLSVAHWATMWGFHCPLIWLLDTESCRFSNIGMAEVKVMVPSNSAGLV